MLRIFIGFDEREAAVFHACVHSLIKTSSVPLSITPLALSTLRSFYREEHSDGSNAFIYSRFLVPYLCGFSGRAIYLDGDMIVRGDIIELDAMLRGDVAVVKHDYKTSSAIKYLGSTNPDYPRKNWSSVIVWNCSSSAHRVLTPEFVRTQAGSFLHRFQWLRDERIQGLPPEWNWLVGEYGKNPGAKLVHYTLGSPCFEDYRNCDHASDWKETVSSMLEPLRYEP